MYLDGSTQGCPCWLRPLPWSPTVEEGYRKLKSVPYPAGNCRHAAELRLRRLPIRLRPRPLQCVYCRVSSRMVQPCLCPSCGASLTNTVDRMTAAELFKAARLNGLRLTLEWQKVDGARPGARKARRK